MDDRSGQAKAFLHQAGWGRATRSPLAGDASGRRYDRLIRDASNRAILMDAPPQSGEVTRPFLRLSQHLRAIGLSAPDILAQDTANGFLLLEDLGDDLFARLAEKDPETEARLYHAAIDVLVHIHSHEAAENLPHFDAATLAEMVTPAFDWYARGCGARARRRAVNAFKAVLEPTTTTKPVMALRDFHAENLLWLPERQGVARVGLLDFQDAMITHPAYDLVSLVEDARRDISPDLAHQLTEYYIARTGHDPQSFGTAAAVIGAQRNLRILGVFARLTLAHDKPRYVDFIPRVWAHLMRDLEHPDLARLRDCLLPMLPKPSPEFLTRMKKQCGTNPAP